MQFMSDEAFFKIKDYEGRESTPMLVEKGRAEELIQSIIEFYLEGKFKQES